MSAGLGRGDLRLRRAIFVVVAIELGFIVFLTVFLWNHADPMGDGMEMVGVGAAVMLMFLPFSLPAFILAEERRALVVAAGLAGLAALLLSPCGFSFSTSSAFERRLGVDRCPLTAQVLGLSSSSVRRAFSVLTACAGLHVRLRAWCRA